jgi:hypothetical protein
MLKDFFQLLNQKFIQLSLLLILIKWASKATDLDISIFHLLSLVKAILERSNLFTVSILLKGKLPQLGLP